MKQSQALNLMKLGKNIFLTGAAGAGKTYLLNSYIKYLKEHHVDIAVTASTGIAATHLQGTTIHSWSGIGVKDHLTKHDLEKLEKNSRIRRNFKLTKVLIIDEVSMLHNYQLDMVNTLAQHISSINEPFGGIQVILCGDFFQLPPISSFSQNDVKFAFESSAWESGDFHICYLEEQHRQDDDVLLTVLNDIRSGTAGEHTKVPLRTRYKKEPAGETKATKLYSRNINVDAINDSELSKIDSEEKSFTMTSAGLNMLVEALKRNCLAPEQLKLKVGAEVMFIKNDVEGKFVNGTRATVIGFDRKEGWPIVKTYDNRKMIVTPEEWKHEEDDKIRAVITQVPLRLAWAITIHKSQGMTLDAAEIDLGDAFEPGMGYVALSRVRSLSGLKLMNLNEMALKVNAKILQHDHGFKELSDSHIQYLNTLSNSDLKLAHKNTLMDRFCGKTTKEAVKKKTRSTRNTLSHLVTLELLNDNLSLTEISKKRNISIESIIKHLEKLKATNQIDLSSLSHIKDNIPKADFDIIAEELAMSEDGKLKAIYEKYMGKYSYASLNLVRLFVDR
ncbi:MAG TPA: AAA family ATPase [Gammaproteobacteria bacterium]|nr:AAA family ATPase [Gammaproteobacteria bacterium]